METIGIALYLFHFVYRAWQNRPQGPFRRSEWALSLSKVDVFRVGPAFVGSIQICLNVTHYLASYFL
jgi:hypothetical protein